MFTYIITKIVIGFVAGWIAGEISNSRKKKFWENVGVGLIGSFLGSWLFGMIGISFSGLIGSIIGAVLGALILLWLIKKFR
ncbi:GlsB/YeaQ/YmgE family stress response membrane protein [Mycoplasmatota bacterium zrk1]